MNRILVIGSSNTDMVIKTEKLPAPGETVLGGTFFMNPGVKELTRLLQLQGLVAKSHLSPKLAMICLVARLLEF